MHAHRSEELIELLSYTTLMSKYAYKVITTASGIKIVVTENMHR
jgi:hypothetical protein